MDGLAYSEKLRLFSGISRNINRLWRISLEAGIENRLWQRRRREERQVMPQQPCLDI